MPTYAVVTRDDECEADTPEAAALRFAGFVSEQANTIVAYDVEDTETGERWLVCVETRNGRMRIDQSDGMTARQDFKQCPDCGQAIGGSNA